MAEPPGRSQAYHGAAIQMAYGRTEARAKNCVFPIASGACGLTQKQHRKSLEIQYVLAFSA